ncbi:cadherin-like and PC-esterase domain-containing protein 1 isoform X3 [Lampetra fluviatilis]
MQPVGTAARLATYGNADGVRSRTKRPLQEYKSDECALVHACHSTGTSSCFLCLLLSGRSHCCAVQGRLLALERVDAEARGVLGSLALEPPLELWPLFEPRVCRYEARAAFPVLLLRLVASAQHCEEHVRIGESTGRRGAAHWPLGVGLTQVNVFVMAVGGVARVYTLRVFRDPRPSSSLTRPWNGTVCGLQQDCSFALWDRQPCGLRPLPRGSAQLDEQSPPCQGHEQGSWVLPCLSCADSSSCDWSQAAWEVSGCRHPRFSQQQLQQCMLGVKLLVVGDSTARGMMFYLMERLNGTLAHWEQIHGSKHYRFLNRGLTHAAFAYFPQFWVVPQHQRTFEETVMLLIASSRPLIDGWRTVLLLGGVHWLWPHHLRSLDLLLRREGLSRARVLVKTLSMGFGLPVESTRSLSLSEQRALWQRNVGIVQEARTLGFSIVDTWNVTVARPAEFLPGNPEVPCGWEKRSPGHHLPRGGSDQCCLFRDPPSASLL